MSSLNRLSSTQKTQLRNAFTLIDGESRDSILTRDDLINIYSHLGSKPPLDKELTQMLTIDGTTHSEISFAKFTQIMANELDKFDDRSTIANALKVFASKTTGDSSDLLVDLSLLKDSCCSVQLGEIGTNNTLSRSVFDDLTKGFIKEEIDGKKVLNASKWLDAYID